MTAKDYLMRYRAICREIEVLENDINDLIAAIQSAPDRDGMPHGSGTNDQTGNVAARLADLKIEREALISIKWRQRDEIIRLLLQMNDTLKMALLFERYVYFNESGELKTWQQVADAIHVSENYARGRLHSAALQEFERVLNNERKRFD